MQVTTIPWCAIAYCICILYTNRTRFPSRVFGLVCARNNNIRIAFVCVHITDQTSAYILTAKIQMLCSVACSCIVLWLVFLHLCCQQIHGYPIPDANGHLHQNTQTVDLGFLKEYTNLPSKTDCSFILQARIIWDVPKQQRHLTGNSEAEFYAWLFQFDISATDKIQCRWFLEQLRQDMMTPRSQQPQEL